MQICWCRSCIGMIIACRCGLYCLCIRGPYCLHLQGVHDFWEENGFLGSVSQILSISWAVTSLLDIAEVLGILSACGHWPSIRDRCDVWLHGVVTVVMLLVAVIDGVFWHSWSVHSFLQSSVMWSVCLMPAAHIYVGMCRQPFIWNLGRPDHVEYLRWQDVCVRVHVCAGVMLYAHDMVWHVLNTW